MKVIRILTIGLFVIALTPVGASAQRCLGPNPAITHVAVQFHNSNGKLNTYHIVGTVSNHGTSGQPSNVLQFVDIYDRSTGTKLDSRTIPPLPVSGSVNFTYNWPRASDAGAGTTTLTFKIRMVSGTNCEPTNGGSFILTF